MITDLAPCTFFFLAAWASTALVSGTKVLPARRPAGKSADLSGQGGSSSTCTLGARQLLCGVER